LPNNIGYLNEIKIQIYINEIKMKRLKIKILIIFKKKLKIGLFLLSNNFNKNIVCRYSIKITYLVLINKLPRLLKLVLYLSKFFDNTTDNWLIFSPKKPKNNFSINIFKQEIKLNLFELLVQI
jgi:hypothetical protein